MAPLTFIQPLPSMTTPTESEMTARPLTLELQRLEGGKNGLIPLPLPVYLRYENLFQLV
jgi:hypothetical protein